MPRVVLLDGEAPAVRVSRVLLGGTALAAIAYQLTIVFDQADPKPENFFSFFTIQSNLFAGSLLVLLGLAPGLQRRLEGVRGAATLYLTITGFVYFTLLQDADAQLGLTAPWVNVVLHMVMPVGLILDWLLVPPGRRLDRRSWLLWVVFPSVYFVASMVRGYLVVWYPYPFLNPGLQSGYSGVFLTAAVLAVVIAGLAAAVAAGGNARRQVAARRGA